MNSLQVSKPLRQSLALHSISWPTTRISKTKLADTYLKYLKGSIISGAMTLWWKWATLNRSSKNQWGFARQCRLWSELPLKTTSYRMDRQFSKEQKLLFLISPSKEIQTFFLIQWSLIPTGLVQKWNRRDIRFQRCRSAKVWRSFFVWNLKIWLRILFQAHDSVSECVLDSFKRDLQLHCCSQISNLHLVVGQKIP